MTYPQPLQNLPSQRKHHGVRNGCILGFAIVVVALITIGAIATALSGGSKPGSHPAATSATSAAPVSAAPPVANPDGKYNGSCNYTLGNDPVGGTAMATGDIQVRNTGNVGIVIRLKITWPQQGYAALVMTKSVKLAIGASRDVQFHRSLSSNQLDNLQNWQTGHNFADGCTYHGTITSTFGPVS